MSTDAAYLELLHRAREHTLLGSCATLLEWDEDVSMPEGGAEHRAEQQALVARLLHRQATDPRLGNLLGIWGSGRRQPPRAARGIREGSPDAGLAGRGPGARHHADVRGPALRSPA